MTDPLRVLLVEDSPADAKLIAHALGTAGRKLEMERVEDAAAMRAALEGRSWDAVISDWSMPSFSALAALDLLKQSGADVPFIIVSGTIGEETAVEAMRAGARDYVLKDRLTRLAPAVERELREREDRLARRRAEEALRKSEEQVRQLQKMDALGSLAGGVAHDFNNLLSIIISYADLLLSEHAEGDPAREDLDEIRRAGLRAAQLTRQLLLFSRQQVIAPMVLDLSEILSNMDRMLRRIIGDDVELVSAAAPLLGKVVADPTHVEQVIMNLVVNARDAMPKGGKLTLETANVVLGAAYAAEHLGVQPGPHVMLAVSDTGIGMDRAIQSRIFEPFFTTKERGKGTGLGLSTVFGIVQQSKGSIWVYSEPGKGTTFKIYFPRTDATGETHRPPAPGATLRGSETVLVVDDDDQLRHLAAGILRRHGYDVIEARNADEALLAGERAERTIHLLLSDVVMPRMSGPELAKRLAQARPGMKVLCMSGYTGDAVVRHGALDPGVAFLQKPITPDALLKRVREVLDAAAQAPGS